MSHTCFIRDPGQAIIAASDALSCVSLRVNFADMPPLSLDLLGLVFDFIPIGHAQVLACICTSWHDAWVACARTTAIFYKPNKEALARVVSKWHPSLQVLSATLLPQGFSNRQLQHVLSTCLASECTPLSHVGVINPTSIGNDATVAILVEALGTSRGLRLRTLDLTGCRKLRSLPPNFGAEFRHLQRLCLKGCFNLMPSALDHVPTALKHLSLAGVPVTVQHLMPLSCLGELESLDLSFAIPIADRQLLRVLYSCFKSWSGLQRLVLKGCPMVDEMLGHIVQECVQLRDLNLQCCTDVTDVGLLHLTQGCPLLSTLVLSECPMLSTDPIMRLIGCGVRLRCGEFKLCKFASGIGVALAQCRDLHTLNLEGCGQLQDADLVALRPLRGLQTLNLADVPLSPAVCLPIITESFTSLCVLNMRNWKGPWVDPAIRHSLGGLRGLWFLTVLNLEGWGVEADAVAELRTSLPRMQKLAWHPPVGT